MSNRLYMFVLHMPHQLWYVKQQLLSLQRLYHCVPHPRAAAAAGWLQSAACIEACIQPHVCTCVLLCTQSHASPVVCLPPAFSASRC
jgi:hypothetical protein